MKVIKLLSIAVLMVVLVPSGVFALSSEARQAIEQIRLSLIEVAPSQPVLQQAQETHDLEQSHAEQPLLELVRLARSNDSNAQLELAKIFAAGDRFGLKKDLRESAIWCRKSALNGNVEAQIMLANIYFKGTGYPRDSISGYAWLVVATGNGNHESPLLRDAIRQRDAVAAGMSVANLQRGRDRAGQIARFMAASPVSFAAIVVSRPAPHSSYIPGQELARAIEAVRAVTGRASDTSIATVADKRIPVDIQIAVKPVEIAAPTTKSVAKDLLPEPVQQKPGRVSTEAATRRVEAGTQTDRIRVYSGEALQRLFELKRQREAREAEIVSASAKESTDVPDGQAPSDDAELNRKLKQLEFQMPANFRIRVY